MGVFPRTILFAGVSLIVLIILLQVFGIGQLVQPRVDDSERVFLLNQTDVSSLGYNVTKNAYRPEGPTTSETVENYDPSCLGCTIDRATYIDANKNYWNRIKLEKTYAESYTASFSESSAKQVSLFEVLYVFQDHESAVKAFRNTISSYSQSLDPKTDVPEIGTESYATKGIPTDSQPGSIYYRFYFVKSKFYVFVQYELQGYNVAEPTGLQEKATSLAQKAAEKIPG